MICRLCLNELEEFISIFEKKDLENQSSIPKIIAKHLHIKLDAEDAVSNKICKFCCAHLEDFHTFWLLIEEKQQTLRTELQDFKCSPFNVGPNIDETLITSEKNTVKDELLCEQPIDTILEELDAAVNDVLSEVTDAPYNAEPNNDEPLITLEKNTVKDELLFEQPIDAILYELDNAVNEVLLEVTDAFEETAVDDEVTPTAQPTTVQPAQRTCRLRKTNSKIVKKSVRLRSHKIKSENNEEAKTKKARNARNNSTITQHDAYIAEHGSLICCICKQLLQNFAELKTHFRKAHKCRGYMKCCNNRYAKRTQYVDHLKLHNNPEFFKCKECDKLLANRNSFQNHMASCHPSEEELKFQCSFCERKFAKQYILDYHLNSHRTGEKKYKCEVCQKGYRSLTEMKQHQKRVHFSAFKIMCDICGKHFKSKQSFQKHSEVMHQTAERPEAECKICGKWLKDDRSLYKHMYKHRDENSGKEFICTKCGAVKKTRQTLNSHMRYHHSETMHKCSLCEKQFKRVRCLEEHMATHTGQALYTCSFCPQTFKSHANMHNHKKKVHPNDWVRKYSRPTKTTSSEVIHSDKIKDNSLK